MTTTPATSTRGAGPDAPGRSAIPVLLDCDPGHDDAFAIMLAAAHPAIDLRSITTVGGNQTLERVTLNAQRVCTLAGITDVPIAAGLAGSLRGALNVAANIHGESGMDGPQYGEPTVPVSDEPGVDQLRRIITDSPLPVTIVATGPLTNIAALFAAHPEVKRNVAHISLMGGGVAFGNVTPLAEFNIWIDPEAADIVFGSGVPITMCGLDVTHQALATDAVLERLRALDTELSRTCVELLTYFAGTYRDVWGMAAPPVHDPVAVACLIDPGLVRTQDAVVDIELTGTHTRGATVCDLHRRTERATNARVALGLDADGFWDLVVAAVRDLG